MDGHGYITGYDRDAEQTWRRYGVALAPRASSGFPGPGNAINQTGIWEAIRRASHWLRWIDRSLFIGYAVENGKSILWFSRYLTVSGVQVDMWVDLLDQITHDAPEKGWSNRWVLDVCLIPGDTDTTSWKPSAFGDIFAMPDRCATCAYGYPPPGLEHANLSTRGQESNTVIEQPPGYRYIPLVEFSDITQEWLNDGNLNDADSPDAPNFYRSCRIYEPPVEVESVELDGEEVKVTLVGRLHHAETAPASIVRDISQWVLQDILDEGYRTAENGLRLYLLWQAGSGWPEADPGDHALTVGSESEAPKAAIIPRFLFTRLIPVPYDDSNDDQDPHDTPLWHDTWQQLDFYIRAICEGFLDPDSVENAPICTSDGTTKGQGPHCLRYEKLAKVAASRVHLPGVSFSDRDNYFRLTAPSPNLYARAEVYQAYDTALNLLHYVPVWLPWRVKILYVRETGTLVVPDTSVVKCNAAPDQSPWTEFTYWTGAPPALTDSKTVWDWEEVDAELLASLPVGRSIKLEPYGADWLITHTLNHLSIKIEPPNNEAWNAVPETIRSYVQATAETWLCADIIQISPAITSGGDGCRYTPDTSETWEQILVRQQEEISNDPAPEIVTAVYATQNGQGDVESVKSWDDLKYLYHQNHPIALLLDLQQIWSS